MRVAVLGSWDMGANAQHGYGTPLAGTLSEFEAACREIGQELIRRGHSLIVGSAGRFTADRHAALGALSAVAAAGGMPARPRIMIVRRRARKPAFEPERHANPGVFIEELIRVESEGAAKLMQARLADAVILVGGGEHTEQAGLAAAAYRKPLACIGSFGGAARAMNARLVEAPAYWGFDEGSEKVSLLQLQEPFGPLVLKVALELAGIEGAPIVMLIHGRSSDRDLLKHHLQRLGVRRVIVLADEFSPSEPIPLKLERYAATAAGAIALLTPDDFGMLQGDSGALEPRARQNVWIEVGWFWGRRGRPKVLLLRKGMTGLPSDIANVEYYNYTGDPTEECDRQIRAFVARLLEASESAAT